MNLSVALATLLLAALCGGGLVLADARARRNLAHLRTGTVESATVVAYAVQHRKPVAVCALANGHQVTVITYGSTRVRKGDVVPVRYALRPRHAGASNADAYDAELVDEPRRTIGRAVGISLGVCILLLGLVLAALS